MQMQQTDGKDDLIRRANALIAQAGHFRRIGEIERTLRTSHAALELYTLAGDQAGKVEALNILSWAYQLQGRYADALAALETILAIIRELGDRPAEAATLHNIANIYQSQGRWNEALRLYEISLTTTQALGDRHAESQTLNNLGSVYQMQGRYAEALVALETALAIFRELGDRHSEAATLHNIANIYQSQEQWNKALQLYEISLATKRDLGDRLGEAQTLHNLGNVYQLQGRYADALPALEDALTIFHELGDQRGEAQTLNNLGLLYRKQGKFENALEALSQSQNIFATIGLVQQVKRVNAVYADVASELGKQFIEQGRWYDGLRLLEESLVIYRQNENLARRADIIYQIARTHHLMGNFDKARVHYRDALRLYHHTDNQRGIAACKTSLGRLAVQMGFSSDAVQELEQAHQIYNEIGDAQRANEVEEVLKLAGRVKERQLA